MYRLNNLLSNYKTNRYIGNYRLSRFLVSTTTHNAYTYNNYQYEKPYLFIYFYYFYYVKNIYNLFYFLKLNLLKTFN